MMNADNGTENLLYLNEQLEHLLLARPIGWQVVDKNIKSLWSGFQNELIGVRVSE